ncbi:MAG: hypothetical protein Q4C87_05670 [Actinomycetaceae bacterium]|nr:hypothetical protein [Actinomycetaceae bacterium]
MNASLSWPVLRRFLICVTLIGMVVTIFTYVFSGEEAEVWVTRQPLRSGEEFSADHLEVKSIPKDLVPSDVIPVGAPLPDQWNGGDIGASTILTESLLDGSIQGRELTDGWTRLSVVLPANQVPVMESGDIVEAWATSDICDVHGCSASSVAQEVRIASIATVDDSAWADSSTLRLELIVKDADIDVVLGHARAGTLSLVLRSYGGKSGS